MDILGQAIQVIAEPPGDLVYFLVMLFALQQALVSALSADRANPGQPLARRWLWAVGGMLIGRIALTVLGLLGVTGLLTPSGVLPPFERWLIIGSALAMTWASLAGAFSQRWHTPVVVGLLALSLVIYGYDAIAQSAPATLILLPGNSALWEQAGVLLALGIAITMLALLRPPEWEWGLGVLFFWAVGTVAQLVLVNPVSPIDGWQRLASLVALPMLSILVYRQVHDTGAQGSRRARPSDALPLVEVVQSIGRANDLESALIVASSKLAGLLRAEMCTLALAEADLSDGAEAANSLQVVAIHPPTAVQMDPPRLDLANYEGLRVAYVERRVVTSSSSDATPWLTGFYAALGLAEFLPLAVIPLRHQGRSLGLMLLGGPQDARSWHEQDLEDATLVAGIIAEAIASVRGNGGWARESSGTQLTATEKMAAPQDQQKLMEVVAQAKQQIRTLNGRIRTLVQEIKVRDEEILSLNTELDSHAPAAPETDLVVWQNEVRQLIEERETLHRKIEELTEDRDLFEAERARLNQDLMAAKDQLEQVAGHRELLEEEVANLQARLDESGSPYIRQPDIEDGAREATALSADLSADYESVGLVVADEDGQITMADASARHMLRLPVGEVIGMPLNGAYPDATWAQTVDSLLSHSKNGGPYRAHLSLAVDGDTVEAELAALHGRDGQVDGLVITLRSPENDAERHEAMISLASDFRTPMTAITGYTELLLGEQAGILTAMQQQFLERVKANVEQLNHLLNDLNQIASPDTRSGELSPQPVNLIEIIEEAVMGLAARFRERRLTVQLDLPAELSAVRADRDSLYQIMLRLLSNAALCSTEGAQVIVGAREESFEDDVCHLRISVIDTGGGIAPEDYSRVFRRFYRANQPLVEGMGETGVGMAVAKALVEANGGRIWVESEAGVGSTFSFLLPVEP